MGAARVAARLLATVLATLLLLAAAGAVPLLAPGDATVGGGGPGVDVEKIVQSVRRAAPQLFLGAEELARAAGFALEPHRARTDDGFLLTLHRLAGPAPAHARRRPPVLMVHGIFCASDVWLMTPRHHALAYQLADSGYDVWLANLRGNPYSRQHERLSPLDSAFWNHSWHEMGAFDVPASIDYVLNATQEKSLFYVGHSMGNTVYYVMATTRPEYNAKVRLHVALAPAAFLGRLRTAAVRAVAPSSRLLLRVLERTPEMFPESAARNAFLFLLCGERAPTHRLCEQAFQMAYGPSHPGLNKSQIAFYLTRLIRSTSVRTPAHFAQIIQSGRFSQWDEGTADGNNRRYGRATPPDYPLHLASAPSAIFYAEDDFPVHPDDVEQLAREQKQVVTLRRLPARPFNHMDFLLSPNAVEMVYEHVLKLFAQF